MTKLKEINHGHMYWRGRTLKEAREERDQYLDNLFSHSMAPAIEIKDGHGFVVWRSAYGWEYTIIQYGHTGANVHCQCNTRYEAESRARRHVAQNVYAPGNPGALVRALEWLEHSCIKPEHRAEFDSWVQWQERYHEAKSTGLNDEECRKHADGR